MAAKNMPYAMGLVPVLLPNGTGKKNQNLHNLFFDTSHHTRVTKKEVMVVAGERGRLFSIDIGLKFSQEKSPINHSNLADFFSFILGTPVSVCVCVYVCLCVRINPLHHAERKLCECKLCPRSTLWVAPCGTSITDGVDLSRLYHDSEIPIVMSSITPIRTLKGQSQKRSAK